MRGGLYLTHGKGADLIMKTEMSLSRASGFCGFMGAI